MASSEQGKKRHGAREGKKKRGRNRKRNIWRPLYVKMKYHVYDTTCCSTWQLCNYSMLRFMLHSLYWLCLRDSAHCPTKNKDKAQPSVSCFFLSTYRVDTSLDTYIIHTKCNVLVCVCFWPVVSRYLSLTPDGGAVSCLFCPLCSLQSKTNMEVCCHHGRCC